MMPVIGQEEIYLMPFMLFYPLAHSNGDNWIKLTANLGLWK